MSEDQGAIALQEELRWGSLCNDDIAPVASGERTWGMWHIASLWVGMSVCIPTYMLGANLIASGLNWWQSLFAIFLGNAIVLIPLVLNAHAGTKYGIPFPVYARASFGTKGAHVASLLRALVACGWFGIQTWIGGTAIHSILSTVWSGWASLGGGWEFMGHTLPVYLSFLLFWLVNMYFVWAGTESIKWLETLAAPFLIAMGLALLVWAVGKVDGGIATILVKSTTLGEAKQLPIGQFLLTLFIPAVTAMVGYWATLSLNIPDFTRYARSQKDQFLGQAIGLLTTMPLYAFIGIAVTSATVILYGEAIWDPVLLVSKLASDNPTLLITAMVALLIATLSTNIAANVVSPANSISNLNPQKIGFRVGGSIAGIFGILIMPWELLNMYLGWLITYSGLLGAVGGVIVCDYLVIRRMKLNLEALYDEEGEYNYHDGVNYCAILALVLGISVAFLGKIVPQLSFLFQGAWFTSSIVSFIIYWLAMIFQKDS